MSKCHKRWPKRYPTVGGGELNFSDDLLKEFESLPEGKIGGSRRLTLENPVR